jgi:hypothetical protein
VPTGKRTGESSPAPGRTDSSRRSRWRRLLFWTIVLEIAAIVLFIVTLLLGERSRPTLIFLYLPRLPLLLASSTGALLAPLTRRRVRLLVAIQVVLSLVVLFPVMGLALSTSRTTEHPVHLASYNVFFGKAGRPALIEEIVAVPADIFVIQAAFGSLGEKLRERLPERTIKQDGEFVVVSKFPVRAVEVPPPLPDGARVLPPACALRRSRAG